jgi:hypothetical protein
MSHESSDTTTKEIRVRSTERIAKAVSTPTTGFFATLRGRLRAKGSGARSHILIATLLTVSASFALSAAPALALETPVTGKAKEVTATTATIEGVLNPNATEAVESGEYTFEYSPSLPECQDSSYATEEGELGIALGMPKEKVSVKLTKLHPNHSYAYCLYERIKGGPEAIGAAETFKTLPAPPEILGESASPPGGEVRLEATIIANGENTDCYFQWGESSVTEHMTPCEQEVSGSEIEGVGWIPTGVGSILKGWKQDTTYRYRVVAKNAAGTVEGEEKQFTTGTPEYPEAEAATALTGSSAQLNGVLNPMHVGEAGTYEFIYRQSLFTCLGEGEGTSAEGKSLGKEKEAVSMPVSGLSPGVTYTFCLLARNEAGQSLVGPPETFTLTVAPTVGGESFSNVGSSSVTLLAQIDPGGTPTSYFFEYGPTTAYGSKTAVESAGGGAEVVSVLASVEGLAVESTYHFRLVASNEKAPGGVDGPDESFSTFPTGAVGLPDGRSYELVSPLNLGDATVLPGPGVRAAADGSAVTFDGTAPPVGGSGVPVTVIGSRPKGGNVYLAQRSATGGWTSADIAPSSLDSARYLSFSNDLSTGTLFSEEPVIEGAPTGQDIYSRDDGDGSYQLLAANVTYVDSTQDDSHVLATDGGGEHLYDAVGDQLEPVSVLPNGEEASVGSGVTHVTFGAPPFYEPDLGNAISTDGSRIFWSTVEGDGDEERPQALYVREDDAFPEAKTMQIDASTLPGTEKEKAETGGGGYFWDASSDGSKVFFTDELRLTSNSTAEAGKPDLYEYEVNSEVGKPGTLTDLTVDAKEPANVGGVLGASKDGSYVYFAAGGALAEGATPQECRPPDETESENGRNTKCNVYVVHEREAPKFVATVAAFDGWGNHDGEGRGDWARSVGSRSAYVTPDGHHLIFESSEDLMGFDPELGQEIYMYDFGSGVSCLSCNPSGTSTIHHPGGGIIGWAHSELPASGSSTFALRDVSADGDRVFFDSAEQLVSQSTGEGVKVPEYTRTGLTSVYEWERDGSGSCMRETGCVYLLSGGTSTDIAVFLDASESGDDVFLETRAQLVSQDQGETFEVYDARVGAPPASTSPVCTGSGCQGVPGAQPIFATPSSVTFNGVGNFPPPPSTKVTKKTVKCPRSKKLSNGKCMKRKSRRATKKAKKSNRASHDRRAR